MADPTADNSPDVKENGSAEVESKGGEAEDWDRPGEGTKYNSLGRANSKTLTELMSPHALKGKDLVLSEEEEQRLAAELGNWVCLIDLSTTSSYAQHDIDQRRCESVRNRR
ncbi:hypothetical protein FRB91_000768 [Serendipita sp. 411]|nr:hypothetical protein FRB91_000768 [Serendipita sp. 411]